MKKQNEAIGQLVADLLNYATVTTKMQLTTTPITVAESPLNSPGISAMMVTLHACWEDGRDIEIRVFVSPEGEVQELQDIRYFAVGAMTEWHEVRDYETDDFIHSRMLRG